MAERKKLPTSAFRCAECKAITWLDARERNHAAVPKCRFCGCRFLDRATEIDRKLPGFEPLKERKKIWKKAAQSAARHRRFWNSENPKTPEEIRILFLKKRHRLVKTALKHGLTKVDGHDLRPKPESQAEWDLK